MYTDPQNSAIHEDKSSSRNLIISIVAILLFGSCCLVVGVGGYYGYQAYVAAKEVVDEVKEIYEIPVDPNDPNSPVVPIPFTPFSEAPEGGLGDERAREFVWMQIPIYYQEANCPSPQAETTEITVITQPNAEGSWQEECKVDCGNGTSIPLLWISILKTDILPGWFNRLSSFLQLVICKIKTRVDVDLFAFSFRVTQLSFVNYK